MRFNRGLGWTFWLVTSILFFMSVLMFAASFDGRFPWWVPVGMFAAWIVVVFVLRAVQGRRAVIDFARGTIITHRGTYSLFEITSLGFRYDRRAGNWLNIGVGDRYVTRLHLDGGFFSPPDDTQWMAMRHLLALKMQMHFRPDGQYMPPPRSDEMADVRTLFLPEHQISAGEALRIMDAQIRWVLSGKRAASAKSPMRDALLMRYVRF